MEHAHKSETTSKILKVLGIFGSVQATGIICSVVRTKLAALWLGPAGFGLMAVYQSTMDMLCKTAQLNLDQSSVRDLAKNRDNHEAAVRTVAIVRRLALLLGIGGTLAVILFSPLISLWAFGDYSHTLAFAALSLWIIFHITASAESSILRGFDTLRPLAKAALYASIVSLAIAIPLFYFFRLKAIVPVILVYYGVSFAFYMAYRARGYNSLKMSFREAIRLGGPMLRLGGYMTVSNTVTLLASNVLVIFLNRYYGETEAGFYQSGYTLINTYVGIIFTAIVMEFYPRLSTVAGSRMRTEYVVSHELKVTMWILIPVMVAFICLSEPVIRLLYSADFMAAHPYVIIGAAGVFFRAASWCIAYTILARGDGKVFVFTEFASAVVYLSLHIPLFRLFGFEGLGAAYTLWYFIYFLIVYAVYRRYYRLRLYRGPSILIVIGVCVAAITLAGYYTAGPWITLAVVFIPTAWIAARKLGLSRLR